MEALLNSYDAKVDSKKRLTLRTAPFEYYHVEEFADGRVLLSPRELTAPFQVFENTLDMMDRSISNFKENKVSEPVDLTDFER